MNVLKENKKSIIFMALPFILMDVFTRFMGFKWDVLHYYVFVAALFTLLWTALIVGIVLSLRKTAARIVYIVFFVFSLVLYLTNGIYYSLTGFFFNTNLIRMASEGKSYIMDTILGTSPWVYASVVLMIVLAVIGCRHIPVQPQFQKKRFAVVVIGFLVVHTCLPLMYGKTTDSLKWNSFDRSANVYRDFNDVNKGMKITGMYEFIVRNIYVEYLKPEEKITDEEKQFLDAEYSGGEQEADNSYTGIYKGKNVIFLQLEGMDEWLLNENDTPNLWALKEHAINFNDHYSIYTGGGSTFNSELAVNTGFTTPVTFNKNPYSFNENTFADTLPQLFKAQGYSANVFHMNKGEFYSRKINYSSWGYDNYFGLKDVQNYKDLSYKLDRELILNETFYKNMFQQDGPFLNYVITYSPHTPFTPEKEVAHLLLAEKYGEDNIPDLSEEECARLQAGETDNMVGLLIQALKDNDLYDNTVIVAYADHYLYTLNDKTVLDKYKNTSNNLINHTPFFIWSSDQERVDIDQPTSQLNILPTVLNLFGIKYNVNRYLLKDALAPDYQGVVFFSDYSWYDGKVYVEDGKVTNGGRIDAEKLEDTSTWVNNVIRKNDLTLKFDYLKNLSE